MLVSNTQTGKMKRASRIEPAKNKKISATIPRLSNRAKLMYGDRGMLRPLQANGGHHTTRPGFAWFPT